MVSKIDVAWDLFLEGKTSEAKKLVEQDFSIDTCTDFSLLNLMGYLLLALAWVLRYPGKMQAVIGTTKPQHVLEAGKAAEVNLTRKEWYQIYLAAGNDLP